MALMLASSCVAAAHTLEAQEPLTLSWQLDQFSASLKHTGFHGRLEVEGLLTAASNLTVAAGCQQIRLKQHLPPGIFADPYELGNLVSSSMPAGLLGFDIEGDIDVEGLEAFCQATQLTVTSPLHTAKESDTRSAHSIWRFSFAVPLHSRYPEPGPTPTVRTRFMNVTGHHVSLACGWGPTAVLVEDVQLSWLVPAGSQKDGWLVDSVTIAVLVVCVSCLVTTALKNSRSL